MASHPTRCVARVIAGILGLALVCSAAAAGAAEGAAGQEGAAERSARGEEVLYKNERVPITKVFEDYRTLRDELGGLQGDSGAAKAKIKEQAGKLAEIRARMEAEMRPLRVTVAEARKKLRTCLRIINTRPPKPPRMEKLPVEPRTSTWRSSHRQWRQRCAEIERRNEERRRQYERLLNEYKRRIAQAKAEKPQLQATIRECDEKTGALRKAATEESEPVRKEQTATQNRLRTLTNKSAELRERLSALAEPLLETPEDVRLRHDILEHEGAFHTLQEAETLQVDLQAEINQAREEREAKLKEAGRELPETWKHPKQNKLDALKALIEKAKAARAAGES